MPVKEAKTISVQRAADLLTSFAETSKGRFGRVAFINKEGELRWMLFRLGVKSYLKGGKLTYNPADYGLLTVADAVIMRNNKLKGLNANPYRSINLKTLRHLVLNNVRYDVE